ncbi:hypothetical protein KJ660_00190, partial [Candidatus Micrarchaeota archaeon]|nr:hypothetical protein [Candidatus Micrarchaeota archaeon]
HLLALGIHEEIPEGIPLDEAIDSIHSQGGIAIAAHPFDLKNEGIKKNALKCDAIESFNAINLDRISNLKAKKFAEKNNLIQVSGSDAHCIEMMGSALIEVKAEKNTDSVLKAIKKGNIFLSNPTYTPIGVIQYYALRKLQLSFPFVQKYILENYAHPKKFLSLRMLNLVQKSPGRIDYFFKFLTYFSYSSTLFYAFGRELVLPIKR